MVYLGTKSFTYWIFLIYIIWEYEVVCDHNLDKVSSIVDKKKKEKDLDKREKRGYHEEGERTTSLKWLAL